MPLAVPGLINSDVDNTFGGINAGKELTNGQDNVFIGDNAGQDIDTGSYNVVVGANLTPNTFDGALSRSVGIGYNAFRNSDGFGIGDGCVFIGYNAGQNAVVADNRLFINNASGTFPLIYGEFDNAFVAINGSLSIGSKTNPGGNGINLPQENTPLLPTFSFGDGDSGFYEIADDQIRLSLGGTDNIQMTSTSFSTSIFGGFRLLHSVASGTNPTLQPKSSDTNTGIGGIAADNLSMICGGLEAGRFEDPADLVAGETSLWLFDDDNNTIEQVTVGTADSGGAGFKVLRIPN